jgi:hypothetical protein
LLLSIDDLLQEKALVLPVDGVGAVPEEEILSEDR